MYAPYPPSSHPASCPAGSRCRGAREAAGAGVGAGLVRGGADEVAGPVRAEVRDGAGEGFLLVADGLGEGSALRLGAGFDAADGPPGADCATGAVGRVDPTTKWMVRMTAVTLAAVQVSQMIR
ncbi:hypothetical protein [Streptomyces ziwulingensis]|uniref:hypothetical protein n=1 Tax=Streptomyces ziwulingensis TaxID=1045501 RepID=UPI0031E78E82